MAQIVQCDFCGNITNEPAATIHIDINPRTPSRLANGPEYITVERKLHLRDACLECLKKFLANKPVPLSISPEVQEKL